MTRLHPGRSGWDLVAAAQAGDRDAFGQLYGRYVGGVARFLGNRVQDRDLVEDLTSETFTRALRRIDSVHDQGRDVGAWFTTIARNLLADQWKSSRHQRDRTVAAVPEHATSEPGPEEMVIDRDTAAEVRQRVAGLSPDQQECLRLRFWQGLSGPETAAVMGRRVDAVKALQHRAVETLRAELTAGGTPRPVGEGGDPLARARQAVTEVAARVAALQRETVERVRAERVARWQAEDRITTQQPAAQVRDVVA
ncbi:MAG TPA: sigma-70 family RNA polymerase sigma factor [Pseudonocardiaceae bacterium]|jgi:RNA polymerase sigma-70 factor (ECF subfamily)